MDDPWESAWDRLNDAFESLADSVQSAAPGVRWRAEHHETEGFPFRAYASFSRSLPFEEDLVLAVAGRLQSGRLTMTSDVSRGDGEIVFEGPESSLSLATDNDTVRAFINGFMEEAITFIRRSTPWIVRDLSLAGDSGDR